MISITDIVLGDLIYYSSKAYPGYSEVEDVAVYFGYDTVLLVNEKGEVVCTQPVDKKISCFLFTA